MRNSDTNFWATWDTLGLRARKTLTMATSIQFLKNLITLVITTTGRIWSRLLATHQYLSRCPNISDTTIKRLNLNLITVTRNNLKYLIILVTMETGLTLT